MHDWRVTFLTATTRRYRNPVKLRLQLVIPESVADAVIYYHHTKFMGAGHAGFLRSLMTITQKYYIPGLPNRLVRFIDQCGPCLKLKDSKRNKTNLPLKIMAAKCASAPFQKLLVDYCGPFTYVKYDYKFICAITCEFTQYTWNFATKSQSTEVAVSCINLLIKVQDVPVFGISIDRGSQFTSGVMQALAELYNIVWRPDLSHTPSSTGAVEYMVGITRNRLTYAIWKNNNLHVFDVISDVTFSVNCTLSCVTSVCPPFSFHVFTPLTSWKTILIICLETISNLLKTSNPRLF